MVALISDKRRDLSSEGITTLLEGLGSMRLPEVPWSTDKALRTIHHSWKGVPEAQQFMQLLRLLHDKQAQYDDVANARVDESASGSAAEPSQSPTSLGRPVEWDEKEIDASRQILPMQHGPFERRKPRRLPWLEPLDGEQD